MTHVEFVEQLKQELPATSRQGDWARDYGKRKQSVVKRACATSALIAAAVVVGGLYFVGCWVIPFFRALAAAR
jgi:hypothetical protein